MIFVITWEENIDCCILGTGTTRIKSFMFAMLPDASYRCLNFLHNRNAFCLWWNCTERQFGQIYDKAGVWLQCIVLLISHIRHTDPDCGLYHYNRTTGDAVCYQQIICTHSLYIRISHKNVSIYITVTWIILIFAICVTLANKVPSITSFQWQLFTKTRNSIATSRIRFFGVLTQPPVRWRMSIVTD